MRKKGKKERDSSFHSLVGRMEGRGKEDDSQFLAVHKRKDKKPS